MVRLYPYPLDVFKFNLLVAPVVEFGSPWRFVRGDSLRVLNAATILQKVRADLQTLLNMTLPTLSNQFDQTTLAVIERALLGPSGVHWVVAILVDLCDSF